MQQLRVDQQTYLHLRLNHCKPQQTQGYYYLSIKGIGQGANPTVGFSSYGSIGTYTLSLASTAPTTVTCFNPPAIQLPQAGNCSAAQIAASDLYNATDSVIVTPALQSQYSPGTGGTR
jgi:hypothetical protein